MAELVIRYPAARVPAPPPRGPHPKAVLAADNGVKLVLPYAPRGTQLGGWADEFDQLARPGRPPLPRRTGDGLPTLNLTIPLTNRDHQASIEPALALLRRLAESGNRIVIGGLSRFERGPWLIDDVTVTGELRQHGSNALTRATVSLSLVSAGPPTRVGPLSGGHRKRRRGSDRRRVHRWAKGDNLRRLANRYYGEPGLWRRIARANNIKNPRTIKPGRRLTIPPAP